MYFASFYASIGVPCIGSGNIQPGAPCYPVIEVYGLNVHTGVLEVRSERFNGQSQAPLSCSRGLVWLSAPQGTAAYLDNPSNPANAPVDRGGVLRALDAKTLQVKWTYLNYPNGYFKTATPTQMAALAGPVIIDNEVWAAYGARSSGSIGAINVFTLP